MIQKIQRLVVMVMLLSMFSGCASSNPYKGRGPNFKLKTEQEVEAEIEAFTMEGNGAIGELPYRMGGKGYHPNSLLPIVREVSAASYDDIKAGVAFQEVGNIVTLVGLLGGIAGLVSFEGSKQNPYVFAGAIVALSGLGIEGWGSRKVRMGVQQYNYDLRRKFELRSSADKEFAPYLQVSWDY